MSTVGVKSEKNLQQTLFTQAVCTASSPFVMNFFVYYVIVGGRKYHVIQGNLTTKTESTCAVIFFQVFISTYRKLFGK